MSEFTHENQRPVSRRYAAERLTDMADALTAGPPLGLSVGGKRSGVAPPDELFLRQRVTSKRRRSSWCWS
jgi:hypothetical protein